MAENLHALSSSTASLTVYGRLYIVSVTFIFNKPVYFKGVQKINASLTSYSYT